VKGLSSAEGQASSDEALKRADLYLQGQSKPSQAAGFSRTVINSSCTPKPTSPQENTMDQNGESIDLHVVRVYSIFGRV